MFTKTNFITNNYAKFLQFILIFTLISILLMTCSDTSGGDNTVKLAVSELPRATRSATVNVTTQRLHYIALYIKSTDTTPQSAKLALVPRGTAAPSSASLLAGAGVFLDEIGTSNQLLVMAFDINSTIGTYVKNIANKNPENRSSVVSIHGKTDTYLTSGSVDVMLLAPGTTYTLYAVKRSGGIVINLGDFSTDTLNTANLPTDSTTDNDPELMTAYAATQTTNYEADTASTATVLPLYFRAMDDVYVVEHGITDTANSIVQIASTPSGASSNTLDINEGARKDWSAILFPSESVDSNTDLAKDYGTGKNYQTVYFVTAGITNPTRRINSQFYFNLNTGIPQNFVSVYLRQ